jgi:hypothetical protein
MAGMNYFMQIFPSFKPSFSFLLAVSLPMLGMQIVSFMLQKLISAEVKLICGLFTSMMVAVLITIIP